LAQALAIIPKPEHRDLLVGTNTADDAGIYRINDECALVYTIDILTPAVSDPFVFGQIAATNCISDIYAMGGEPRLALNIVGFPNNGDPEILGEMLLGGQKKAAEAGVLIIGGHTFTTKEIKYGLTVIGFIDPNTIISNAGAQGGDIIVLTKPIGGGTMIQATILKKKTGVDIQPVIEHMTTLNRDASRAMKKIVTHAATDITGFGLMGHLVEMAAGSKKGIEVYASKIPLFEGARSLIEMKIMEPGIAMNQGAFATKVDVQGVDEALSTLLFGSETSGGLAIAMPADQLAAFTQHYQGIAAVIGKVIDDPTGKVVVKP
jgi:selenide,water dikinase